MNLMDDVMSFLPTLLAGLAVVLVGLLVSWLFARALVRVLIWLRLDRVVARFRWGGALGKGDVRHTLYAGLGGVAGILLFLPFLDNALVVWKLTVLSRVLERLVFRVPDLLGSVLIMGVGYLVAAGVSRSVRQALYEENVARAALVGRVARAAVLVLAAAMALVELEFARTIVTYAFLIAFGALAAAFVLAVGLGSREAVALMWRDLLERRGRETEKAGTGTGEA